VNIYSTIWKHPTSSGYSREKRRTCNHTSTWGCLCSNDRKQLQLVKLQTLQLVHALVLWNITCIKGVRSQKELKGCTLPKDWNLWEFDMTRQYEGDPQPSSPKDWFCRDCLTVSYYPPLDPKGHLNGRLLPKSFATLLSLAKNHEIVILSSQLWGRRKTPHQKNIPPEWKKITIWKGGKQSS